MLTKAVEKYDSSRQYYRPNKSRAVMPSKHSAAEQVDLVQHDLLYQMESCTEPLDEKDVIQTHATYECSSDESESDMDDNF